MSITIFNSLGRAKTVLQPLEPGHVKMYVCGMTIYDLCHMGHARMMLSFDTAARWLRASGYRVTYVRNITDIDDKIIRRATERGITLRALTDEMTEAMHRDVAALGIEAPTHEPRATDYVPQMLTMVSQLEERGLAYRAASGDVNYAVRRFPGYGKLSGKSLGQLRAGERVAIAEGKDDPLDFVLWKAAKPHEPLDARYESTFGPGRPGWHIECSAMSCALLGETFDIHGGGLDLQFPHHENEIAQSEGVSGQPFAKVWMHNGFLNVDDEKMSKSLGNFFTIRDVLKSFDGETIRLFMLQTHYRSPFNHSEVGLKSSQQALDRLYAVLNSNSPTPDSDSEIDLWSDPRALKFKAAMDDDFNTPKALAVLFELAAEASRLSHDEARKTQAAQLLKKLGGCLGLLQSNPRSRQAVTPPDIQAMMAARTAARNVGDWAAADRLRDQLLARGVTIKDSARPPIQV